MKTTIGTAATLAIALIGTSSATAAFAQEQRPVEREILTQKIAPTSSWFGRSTDAEDGRLMVGTDRPQNPATGRVDFYVLNASGGWDHEDSLNATNDPLFQGEPDFGRHVALGGGRGLTSGALEFDGSSLVGAIGYVTSLVDGEWRIEAALATQLDVEVGAEVVALDIDGDRAVVSINLGYTTPVPPGSRRRALVFERDPITASWSEVAILEFPDGQALADFSDFGRGVAIEGDDLFVSDPHVYGPPTPQFGAVFRYRRDAAGSWNLEQRLLRPNPPLSEPNSFGESIALDDGRIVIAAPLADQTLIGYSGLLFTFERLLDGSWNWVSIQSAPADVEAPEFGAVLDLEDDVVAVATGRDILENEVLVFRIEPDRDWTLAARFTPTHDLDGYYDDSDPTNWRTLAVTRGAAVVGHALYNYDIPTALLDGQGVLWCCGVPSLTGTVDQLSLTIGGTQELHIDAGPALAGGFYLMLGSLSGTQATVPMPFSRSGLTLTLDPYTDLLIAYSGAGIVSPMFGVLDSEGRAEVDFKVPAGSPLGLLGVNAWHAAILYTPGAFELFGATNAKSAWLLP